MGDVGAASCEVVIDAQHFVALAKQAFAKMRPEKAGSSGDEDALAFVEFLGKRGLHLLLTAFGRSVSRIDAIANQIPKRLETVFPVDLLAFVIGAPVIMNG